MPRDRSLPRLSQDFNPDPVQFSPASAAATNDWRTANPEAAAYQDAGYNIPWWEPWMGIAGVTGLGLALPAIAGGGGAAAAGGTGIGSGVGTGAGTGVGIGTGAGYGASLPIGGVGGTGLLAGTPGVSGAALFGGGAVPAAAGFTPAATSTILGNTPGITGAQMASAAPGGFWSGLGSAARDYFLGRGGQGQGAGGALPGIARILQGLSQGRAQGRMSEAEAARLYDYLNLARTRTYYDRAGQELDQRKFGQDLQERSFGNATRAAFMQNARPGGIRIPSELASFQGQGGQHLGDIPQGTRDEIGGSMYRNAITELLDPLQPGTATSGRRMAALPEPEPISPTPEASGFDTALNWASIIAGGLPTQQTTPTPPPQTPTPRPATQPPAPVEPRRSTTSSVTPGMQLYGQPFRELPRATSPNLSSLSTPTAASQYASPPPSASQPTGIGSNLPGIASLVPDVPTPTAPLGSGRLGQPFRQLPPEYDEFGRPIRGGR